MENFTALRNNFEELSNKNLFLRIFFILIFYFKIILVNEKIFYKTYFIITR